MASYLEQYAARFQLPVRSGVRVERLFKRGGRYVVKAGAMELETEQVVVAMASYQRPKVPDFAGALSREVVQMHSTDYRNLAQLGRASRRGRRQLRSDWRWRRFVAVIKHQVAGGARCVPFGPESFWAVSARAFCAPVRLHRLLTVRTRSAGARPNSGQRRAADRVKPRGSRRLPSSPRVVGTRDG
jgi:hypothetical protein